MSKLGIPETEISNYSLLSVQILYSNVVGIPITVGSEGITLTGQPISLVDKSDYFRTAFQKIDFRYSPLAIFDQFTLNGNFKAFTSIWNYVNGATEIYETLRNLNYTTLIQMLPFITEFKIRSKSFYDTYLKLVTGFSSYDNYEVSLMRSATPKLIIELDNFFAEDRTLSNYWKQKLATGLANLEGPNPNLANISIKPIENKMETCNILSPIPTYIPTMKPAFGSSTIVKNTF